MAASPGQRQHLQLMLTSMYTITQRTHKVECVIFRSTLNSSDVVEGGEGEDCDFLAIPYRTEPFVCEDADERTGNEEDDASSQFMLLFTSRASSRSTATSEPRSCSTTSEVESISRSSSSGCSEPHLEYLRVPEQDQSKQFELYLQGKRLLGHGADSPVMMLRTRSLETSERKKPPDSLERASAKSFEARLLVEQGNSTGRKSKEATPVTSRKSSLGDTCHLKAKDSSISLNGSIDEGRSKTPRNVLPQIGTEPRQTEKVPKLAVMESLDEPFAWVDQTPNAGSFDFPFCSPYQLDYDDFDLAMERSEKKNERELMIVPCEDSPKVASLNVTPLSSRRNSMKSNASSRPGSSSRSSKKFVQVMTLVRPILTSPPTDFRLKQSGGGTSSLFRSTLYAHWWMKAELLAPIAEDERGEVDARQEQLVHCRDNIWLVRVFRLSL